MVGISEREGDSPFIRNQTIPCRGRSQDILSASSAANIVTRMYWTCAATYDMLRFRSDSGFQRPVQLNVPMQQKRDHPAVHTGRMIQSPRAVTPETTKHKQEPCTEINYHVWRTTHRIPLYASNLKSRLRQMTTNPSRPLISPPQNVSCRDASP